jgi:hypothetical protein
MPLLEGRRIAEGARYGGRHARCRTRALVSASVPNPMNNRATPGSWVKGQSGNPKGRPKGSRNKRTRTLQAKAIEAGVLPIEVMLGAVAHFRRRARRVKEPERSELLERAAAIAAKVAPYIHPRLASIESRGSLDINQKVTEEVRVSVEGRALLEETVAGLEVPVEGPKGGQRCCA